MNTRDYPRSLPVSPELIHQVGLRFPLWETRDLRLERRSGSLVILSCTMVRKSDGKAHQISIGRVKVHDAEVALLLAMDRVVNKPRKSYFERVKTVSIPPEQKTFLERLKDIYDGPRTKRITVCPVCATPVMGTLAFSQKEFFCMACKWTGGLLDAETIEGTPEMWARYAQDEVLFNAHEPHLYCFGRLHRKDCVKCADRGEQHGYHHEHLNELEHERQEEAISALGLERFERLPKHGPLETGAYQGSTAAGAAKAPEQP